MRFECHCTKHAEAFGYPIQFDLRAKQVNGYACFSQERQIRFLGMSCVLCILHRRLAVPSCWSDKHHQTIKGPST